MVTKYFIFYSFPKYVKNVGLWGYLTLPINLAMNIKEIYCPGGWGCRIHWLHLCRRARTPPNKCPVYDTKQSDGEVPVMLELWGMWITPSLLLLPDPLWPRAVAPDTVLSVGLIELNCVLMLIWTVWLNWIAGNRNIFDN